MSHVHLEPAVPAPAFAGGAASSRADDAPIRLAGATGVAAPAASASGEDVVDFLAQRFSTGPKYLVQPGPSPEQWRRAGAAALRAPDHGGLRPFRFVIVGDEQRERLATLFAQDAARRGHLADEVERARARAWNGPGLAALVGRVRDGLADVPAHEQWICVGAGLMNFLNALHLMGLGAKTLSGASIHDAAIQAAFCEPGERLLAWIVAGTPTRAGRAKHDDDASRVVGPWDR